MAKTHVKINRINPNAVRIDWDLFAKLYKRPLRLNKIESVCREAQSKNIEEIGLIDLKYEVLQKAFHADVVLIENGSRVKCLKDRFSTLDGKIILNERVINKYLVSRTIFTA